MIINFFRKTVAGTLPKEERLGVFDCFEGSRWLYSKQKEQIQKIVLNEFAKLQIFAENCTRHAPNWKVFRRFWLFWHLAVATFETLKINTAKFITRNLPNPKLFGVTDPDTLSDIESFGVSLFCDLLFFGRFWYGYRHYRETSQPHKIDFVFSFFLRNHQVEEIMRFKSLR